MVIRDEDHLGGGLRRLGPRLGGLGVGVEEDGDGGAALGGGGGGCRGEMVGVRLRGRGDVAGR